MTSSPRGLPPYLGVGRTMEQERTVIEGADCMLEKSDAMSASLSEGEKIEASHRDADDCAAAGTTGEGGNGGEHANAQISSIIDMGNDAVYVGSLQDNHPYQEDVEGPFLPRNDDRGHAAMRTERGSADNVVVSDSTSSATTASTSCRDTTVGGSSTSKISPAADTESRVSLAEPGTHTRNEPTTTEARTAEMDGSVMQDTTEEGPSDGLRKALVGFYGVHNPDRISTLDFILAQYSGKEDLLLERLEQKYAADLSYARRAAGMQPIPDTTSNQRPATIDPAAAAKTVAISTDSKPNTSRSLFAPPGPARQLPAPPAAITSQQNLHQKSDASHSGFQSSEYRPGAPATHSSNKSTSGTSSNYMIYLADQLISNVETLLPRASSGVALGSAGETSTDHSRPQKGTSRTAGTGNDSGGSRSQRNANLGPSHWGSKPHPSAAGKGVGVVSDIAPAGVAGHDRAADPALARVKVLEEERAGLMATCRRLQGKAEAAAREAAATEELREAGQRKIAGFAERAAAAERQAREAAVRLRALETGQAVLQAEKEASVRRCAAKHTQLLSAIDLQNTLRYQLEGLLEVVPLSSTSISKPKQHAGRGGGGLGEATAPDCGDKSPMDPPLHASNDVVDNDASAARIDEEALGRSENIDSLTERNVWKTSAIEVTNGGGGDESGGGGLDEMKRRCSLLEISLQASRREASEARRARDVAERTVTEQRALLATLQAKLSDLEVLFAREKGTSQVAAEAARGLEMELGLRLDDLRSAEGKLSEQAEENTCLREELRGAAARLQTASAAREALLTFCRQERTAVELEAAEHVARAEANAAMRGEESLARGLELARMAEEAGDKRAAAGAQEIDRLGKALFSARAELAGSEAREQALRRELGRAAETIAGFSCTSVVNNTLGKTLGGKEERRESSESVGITVPGVCVPADNGRNRERGSCGGVPSVARPRSSSRGDAVGTHTGGGERHIGDAGRTVRVVGEATRWGGEVLLAIAAARRRKEGRLSPAGSEVEL